MNNTCLLSAALLFSMLSCANAANLYLLPSVEAAGLATGDISADGSVYVGGSQAIRWTETDGIESFLPEIPDVQYSHASGISADGKVISGSIRYVDDSHTSYRWTEEGGLQPLGQLFDRQVALSMSGDGTTVVGSVSDDSPLGTGAATYWTEDGNIHTLPDLGYSSSHAFDVNDDGTVIVGHARDTTDDRLRAVRWINGVGPFDLGRLPGSAYYNSDANAVSPDGKYIVGEAPDEVFRHEAFIWNEQDGMIGLGQICLESYCDLSIAYGVSADGSTVVGRAHSNEGIFSDRAFMWTEDSGMQDLSDYLLSVGVDTQEVLLTAAFGISDDGSTVFGEYFDGSIQGTFIANITTVPIPATVWLFGSGLLGLVGMSRRKKAA